VRDRHGDDVPGRLGHRLVAEIAAGSWRRKAGKTAAREAATLSVARTRVRKVLRELGRATLAENDAVVDLVTAFLREGSLFINKDHVTRALEDVAGVPRVVPGPGVRSG